MSAAPSRRRRDWARFWHAGAETARLVLRPLALADHESWRAGYASRQAPRSTYDPGPVPRARLSRAIFQELVARHQRLARADDVYVLSAFARDTGTHVGAFDLSTIRRRDNGWANIGYLLHNQHQGLGLGAEGLRAAIEFGVKVLGYHRIEAATRLDNMAAIACARAAGMAHEGLRCGFWLDPDGWADHEIFVTVAS